MSYVAIKGGVEAIRSSKHFFKKELHTNDTIADETIIKGMRFACDRIMAEGALYTEKLAARALRLCGGDMLEAAFYVRAHRSTCQRIGSAELIDSSDIHIIRRISSAFKDIKGGQILGPSCDYVIRLFSSLKNRESDTEDSFLPCDHSGAIRVQSALHSLRQEDRVVLLPKKESEPFDVTRSFPLPPYPRSGVMQIMARGETGALLAFAYTTMRGFGDVHPTIGDLRLGMADIIFTHPLTGNSVKVGVVRVTACETVGSFAADPKDGKLRLAVGYGFCYGFNETKAIAMSILDLAMNHKGYSVGGDAIAANPEIVVHHVDAIESMGFTNHFKLPHYVTFQADLQVFNKARKNNESK